MGNTTTDVAIVGAGVAGLAAAAELHGSGVDFLVLEARERAGGRVFTRRDPRLPVPVELGAEFVHGSAPELQQIAERAGLALLDVEGERWHSSEGKFRPLSDFWEKLDRIMRRLDERNPDRSFAEFLAGRPGGRRLAKERALALQWVEGFHAANPRRASTRALAEGGSPGEDKRERRLGRLLGGYDGVVAWLARDISDRIRFAAVVSHITHGGDRIHLALRGGLSDGDSSVVARAAIVSVPLGVLQSTPGEDGAIAFDPPLELDRAKAEALAGMTMGAVVRVTCHVRERFWTSERFARRAHSEELDRLAFLHTSDEDFPVWWTAFPVHAPLLVGWSGGERAWRLSSVGEEQIGDLAVASIARQFRLSRREARSIVDATWSHDWQRDPFARGAYSYALVGGAHAPTKLARPVGRALFFAGEASDAEGRTGTVHGAIGSGRRAARQVLRALGQRAARRT